MELFSEGTDYKIFDNVMPDHVVNKWIEFYENSVSFSACSAETYLEEIIPYGFCMPLDLKQRIEIFEITDWLIPVIQQLRPEFTMRNHHRSYINMYVKGCPSVGHRDLDSKREDQYISSVLFLNPHVDEQSKSGFYLEDNYVENKFNRIVVFDGRLWHKVEPPSDDLIRLTLYNGFSSSCQSNKYESLRNKWRLTEKNTRLQS